MGNLDRRGITRLLFITEEAKETVLHLSNGTVKIFWFHFVLIWH